MGLLSRLEGSSVFIDTAPFVYFVEEREPYAEMLTPFFDAIDAGNIRAFTSTITCSEALVIPCRQGNRELVARYETLLIETPAVTIVPFDLELANTTAELRAKYSIKTPDAIQWATAVEYGGAVFLDERQGIQKIFRPPSTGDRRFFLVKPLPLRIYRTTPAISRFQALWSGSPNVPSH